MLATHPKLLPVLMELGEGAPHLCAMTLLYNAPRQGPPRMTGPHSALHCHGDIHEHDGVVSDKRDNVVFEAKSGRIVTDDWVVFPYLEKCEPGDGGLGVVPGSVKASFPRPPTIAWPFGSEPDGVMEDGPFGKHTGDGSTPIGPQPLLYTKADGSSGIRAPDGLFQVTPDAGDFVIISEKCAHCILAWQPTDRPRAALNLRYYSGSAWVRREKNKVDRGDHLDGDLDDSLTLGSIAAVEGLAPCTRAMVAGRGITAWGEGRAPRL